MEKGTANGEKTNHVIHSSIYEKVKKNNLMDWGEIELIEMIQLNETQKD
jgi:hypothetical protein